MPEISSSELPSSAVSVYTSQSALVSRIGAEVFARCEALQLTTNQIADVSEIADIHHVAPGAVVKYLEDGLSLGTVSTALGILDDYTDLRGADVPTIAAFLRKLGFERGLQLGHTHGARESSIGQSLGAQEALELELLREAGIEPEESATDAPARTANINTSDFGGRSAHDVLATFDEALAGSGTTMGLNALLRKLSTDFGDDLLRVYYLCNEKPGRFRLYLKGKISAYDLLHDEAFGTKWRDDQSPADVFTGF